MTREPEPRNCPSEEMAPARIDRGREIAEPRIARAKEWRGRELPDLNKWASLK